MRLLLQILGAVALVLLIFCLGVVAHVLWQVAPSVEPTVRDMHTTVLEAGLTLKNLREASATWEQASKTQAQASTEVLKASKQALAGVSLLVSNVDTQLNKSLIPSISIAVENQDRALLSSQMKLASTLDDMAAATQQAQMVLVDADKVIADPAIGKAVDNLATASQNAASATAEASATMASIHKGVDYEVHEITKPVSAVKKAMLFITQLAGRWFGY